MLIAMMMRKQILQLIIWQVNIYKKYRFKLRSSEKYFYAMLYFIY